MFYCLSPQVGEEICFTYSDEAIGHWEENEDATKELQDDVAMTLDILMNAVESVVMAKLR